MKRVRQSEKERNKEKRVSKTVDESYDKPAKGANTTVYLVLAVINTIRRVVLH